MKILDKDKNEVIFLKEPTRCFCPYCNNNIITIVEYKNGFLSYLICLIILITIGIIPSIIVIPLVLLVTKTLVHRCSVCFNDLGTDGRIFTLINFHEKILTVRFGEIGFILTRRIILGLILGLALLGLIAYKLKNIHYSHHHHEPFILIHDSWDTFRNECGRDKILLDNKKMVECSNKYIDKSISNWSGHIIRINDYRESIYKYLHHAVVLFIKMIPEESEFTPDLMLTFDSDEAERYKDLLNDLNRGQKIGFNATIKSIGHDMQPKHVHALDFWKEEGFIDISPLINLQGRYSERGQLRRNKND